MDGVAIILAAAVAGAPAPSAEQGASIQANTPQNVISYPAAFFTEARALNAFEMLQRVPGYTFSGGEQVRGFAGAGGNVLIDGERPATKSLSLEALLRRIPANFVDRIELIRGSAPGIDMQGQPIVANVVRTARTDTSFAATVGARKYPGSGAKPSARLDWSRRSAGFSIEAMALVEGDRDQAKGDIEIRSPIGAPLATGPFKSTGDERFYQGSLSAEVRRDVDTFRLNLGGERRNNLNDEFQGLTSTAGATLRADRFVTRAIEDARELGLDWTRTLGDLTTARLIGLHRQEGESEDQRAISPSVIETSKNDTESRESIVRGIITHTHSAKLSLEGGGEAVRNVLRAASAVTENGAPIALPNANVRVTEKRVEGFATAYWKPGTGLTFEAGSRFEASTITQKGDTNASKSFFFPKPRVRVTWDFAPGWQMRLRGEREIGQLDFSDFTASSELSTGAINAGGADLVPQRAWVAEVGIERRFWGQGALVLTGRYYDIQQVIDLVPVQGRFDAPGNIGDGKRQEVAAVLTLPLGRLGVPGALLTAEGTWRRSRVEDPVTGLTRRIARERPVEFEIRLVQDVDRLRSTWGLTLELPREQRSYRISEARLQTTRLQWEVYWDWKPQPGFSLRGSLEQTGWNRTHELIRTRFTGPRSNGVVREVERRDVTFDPSLFVRVRKEW